MRYEIRRNTAAKHSVLTITKDEFESIQDSRDMLLRILVIEQRYDILVGNYLELERQIFHCNSEYVVHPSFDQSQFTSATTLIDRSLGNLLSSARSFIDQAKNGADPDDLKLINQYFADEYDSSLAYRTMEALRNYSQHCGLPTQALHYTGSWRDIEDVDKSRLVQSVVPALSTETLRREKTFKATVLAELEARQLERHPIMPLLREYLGALSHALAHIRELYSDRQSEWLAGMQRPASRYCKFDGNSLGTGVVAVARTEEGSVEAEIHLLSDIGKNLKPCNKVTGPW
jgi:hypothetical protein